MTITHDKLKEAFIDAMMLMEVFIGDTPKEDLNIEILEHYLEWVDVFNQVAPGAPMSAQRAQQLVNEFYGKP